MNVRVFRNTLTATLFLTTPVATSAHHTIGAYYDVMQHISLNGIVQDVEWKQPHVLLHVAVSKSDGVIVEWTLETRAPTILKRLGIAQDFVKPGDSVRAMVCPAKDGSNKGFLQTISTQAGETIVGAGGC
jgi:Family of unknown function (DUF6152)